MLAIGKTAADIKTNKFGRAIVEGRKRDSNANCWALPPESFPLLVSRKLRADNPARGVKRYTDKKGETFPISSRIGQARRRFGHI